VLKSRARRIPATGMCSSTGEGSSRHVTRQPLKAPQQKLGRIKEINETMDKVPIRSYKSAQGAARGNTQVIA